MEEKQKKKEKSVGKLKTLLHLWNGKSLSEDNSVNDKIIQDFVSWIFSFIAWVLLISSFLFLGCLIYVSGWVIPWSEDKIFTNIIGIFITLVIIFFCATISFVLKVMSHDIKREKDRHYVLALFSALVGFVALIVSMVALFK